MKKLVEKRPWGHFERFTLNEKTTVKILSIKPSQELSTQYHNKRKEFWHFLDNPAIIIIGNKKIKAIKGSEFMINKKQIHKIRALSKEVRILEISYGNFEEKDITRISDKYKRS